MLRLNASNLHKAEKSNAVYQFMKFQLPDIKLFRNKRMLSCLLFFCLSHAYAVEIYVSTNVDGIQKWSTQAFDASYTKATIFEAQSPQPQVPLNANVAVAKPLAVKGKIADVKQILLSKIIHQVATKYSVDPELVEALIAVESGFNTYAISPKGARGLMQLMPATAKRYGMKYEQELHIPAKNIDMGVRHLKDLLHLHNGQVALAIAAYNAGQGAVSKHGQRIPAYRETMLYVPAVMSYMARFTDSTQSVQ